MLTIIEQHNIIFDIDARQSGKTTRLCDFVRMAVDNPNINHVWVFAPNGYILNNIRQRIWPSNRISFNVFGEVERVLRYIRPNDRCAFDESDYLPRPIIIGNSYYSTTPSSGITQRMLNSLQTDNIIPDTSMIEDGIINGLTFNYDQCIDKFIEDGDESVLYLERIGYRIGETNG